MTVVMLGRAGRGCPAGAAVPRVGGMASGRVDRAVARPRRDRAARVFDVVVVLSTLVAALRLAELALTPGLLARTIAYAVALLTAVVLWVRWRREARRPDHRPGRLGAYAIGFTGLVASLFFIGDQPLPLFLFVVALTLLLRSYALWAGVLAVAVLLGLQTVLFLSTGRDWRITAEEVLASALLFGFGLIVAWLFAEIDRESRANAALAAEVQRRAGSDAELVTLRERTRVARDLHDGIGHQVTVMLMSLQFAERMRERDADRAWGEVAQAREQAAQTLADIRLLARALHPPGLTGDGAADLSALAASFRGTGLAVTVADDADGVSVAEEVALFRRRFVQEALTNVVRHAAATRVTVTQTVHENTMRLSVLDDGGAGPAVEPGFGLRSLAERAAELGGRTEVWSGAGGVEVSASVPLVPSRGPA